MGVLLASLLKGLPGFEESYQALFRDLTARQAFPRRLAWTGQEEECTENDFVFMSIFYFWFLITHYSFKVKLVDEIPSDYLTKVVAALKKTANQTEHGFTMNEMLTSHVYKRISGTQKPLNRTGLFEHVFKRILGLAVGNFFDPLPIKYEPVLSPLFLSILIVLDQNTYRALFTCILCPFRRHRAAHDQCW